MKHNHLHTKRTPPRGTLFRRLQAITSRRHRVSAAATADGIDLEGDVPHVGVARALLVILIVHLLAIAGIFVHNRFFDGESVANAAPAVAAPTAAEPRPETLPKIADGDKSHVIVAGDTYEVVATRYGVSEDDLRRANDNMVLRAGRILRVPPRRIVAVEPAELANRRDAANMSGRGQVTGAGAAADGSSATSAVDVAGAPRAVVLVHVKEPAAGRAAGSAANRTETTSKSGSYEVKAGDTLWRIATRHKVTPERLMQANGLKDAKLLRAGMELKIPKP